MNTRLKPGLLPATILIFLLMSLAFRDEASPGIVYARKVGMKLKTNNVKTKANNRRQQRITPSGGGGAATDTLFSNILLTGYDKKATSSKESFFIINNNSCSISGIEIEIIYSTDDGRRLHRRICKIEKEVPPGETIKTDIESWDTQHSFYYYLSDPPARRTAISYKVEMTPIALEILRNPL